MFSPILSSTISYSFSKINTKCIFYYIYIYCFYSHKKTETSFLRFLLFALIIYLRHPNHPSGLGQAAVKFFVEIAAPGLEEEVLEDVEVDLFGGGFVGEIAKDVFHGLQEVVPVVDKFLVTGKFRGVEPFFQFHFGFWLFLALAGLEKIPEAATFVVASHGEEATDAGTDAVNAAAAFLI